MKTKRALALAIVGIGLILAVTSRADLAHAGPFVPPPGAPPLALPLPPPAPAVGSLFSVPPPYCPFAAAGPGASLHEITIHRIGAVAIPGPAAVLVVPDLIGADHLHFALSLELVLGDFAAWVIFGGSPPALGGPCTILLSRLSPFHTSLRIDDPLGGMPIGSFAFTVVVTDRMGFVVAVSDPLLVTGTTLPPTVPAFALPDHFKCYEAKGKLEPRDVRLVDQFQTTKTRVHKPHTLCNPVDKNGEGIHDRRTHLAGYRIRDLSKGPRALPGVVFVQNQFGNQILSVNKAHDLLVPSEKDQEPSALTLDHFKCYKATGGFQPTDVFLADQFESMKTTVLRPHTLCNPVEKNREQVLEPRVHLVCYDIKDAERRPRVKRRDVSLRNQFGDQRMTVAKPHTLCVPSFKILPVEVDAFPNSLAEITIVTPFGAETLQLSGPTTAHVAVLDVEDRDGNGREEVPAELVQMELRGVSRFLGPVTVRLRDPDKHPHRRSIGQIEELANTAPAVLDLPPFAPAGSATSFFDVFFEVEVAGQVLHNNAPKRVQAIITHKPPAPGETYQNPDVIPLFDESENDSGFRIGPVFHTPNPRRAVETDVFPNSRATMTIESPAGAETIELSGPTTVNVFIDDLSDREGNGREEVPTELVQMELRGVTSAGLPITVRVRDPGKHPNRRSTGQIEELANSTPGVLDLPPFAPAGSAASFFDVFLEVEVAGQILHTDTPQQMQAIITRKPPMPGETYESTSVSELVDEREQPTGLRIARMLYTPNPWP